MNERLLALEEEAWQALCAGRGAEYFTRCLTDDALLVVPGMVIDKPTFLSAVAKEEPWASYRIEEPRVVQLSDASAVLLYRVRATRAGQPELVGMFSSVYVRRDGAWRMAYHQQTPSPAPS